MKAQDAYDQLKEMRVTCTRLQGQVSSMFKILDELGIVDAPEVRCPEPECGLGFAGAQSLAEHLYVSHGGPVPDHYARIESAALPDIGLHEFVGRTSGVCEVCARPFPHPIHHVAEAAA